MKPNKDRIKKWVEALRSGKYPQGTLQLKDFGCYCCLGVACEVSGVGYWSSYEEYITDGGIPEKESLPAAVREWYGLETDPLLKNTSEEHKIAATLLNDEYGYSFKKIADCIEATYLKEEE